MFSRLRTTWFAGSGAILLVLAISGAALGATVLTAVTGPAPEAETDPLVVDTTTTFEDLDGDGIDDDCDTEVVEDADAAAAELDAVDTNDDGKISVEEAAHSDRVGGKNCNHGGYVSQVARAQGDDDCVTEVEEAAPTATPTEAPVVEAVVELDEDADDDADEETDEAAPAPCPDDEETDEAEAEAEAEAECEATVVPTFDPATATEPGAFGRYVSSIAQSDAVGGKNCNHGGAVSEAVKAAKEAARDAREAAKAERRAEREAAKAERQAAKAAREAARAAKAKPGKGHGRP